MLVGSAIGAGLSRLLKSQPKSAPSLYPEVKVRAALKAGGEYTGSVLNVTDSNLVMGVAGGTLRLALVDLDKVEVLA
jgi:hypothetical protein